MNWSLVVENADLFFAGLQATVSLTFLSLALGFVVAVVCAMLLDHAGPVAVLGIRAYVYVFRGTPLLVQVYLIYFGLPQFEWVRSGALWPILRDPYWCALIAFTLNTGAYTTGILRGAIDNTPAGERSAALAIGMSRWMAFRRVVFPSAFRRALPQYGNEVIFLLHGTVVASVITVTDILGAGRILNARHYTVYEGLLTAAVIYLALTVLVSIAFQVLERRLMPHLRATS